MSVKTVVGCSERVHGGICHCDDDVWLREQATMNRAQDSFVDEHLEQVQSTHDELRCLFRRSQDNANTTSNDIRPV